MHVPAETSADRRAIPVRSASRARRAGALLVLFTCMITAASCVTDEGRALQAPTAVCGITAFAAVDGQQTGVAVGHALLWVDDGRLAASLDAIAAAGAQWIRIDVNWPSTEPVRGTYDWRAPDRVIEAARARGLNVLGVIAYTPPWARPAATSDKHPPSDPNDFGRFAGAVASRYAARGVSHFEIWNEPNTVDFWQSGPNPAQYVSLLDAAYGAIKASNPGATVITAGLAPAADRPDGLTIAPNTFLTRLYASGAKARFDAVGMHPYSYPDMPTAAVPWNPFAGLPATRSVMVANGDGNKRIWGTEYGAPTGNGARAVSEAVQAEMVTDAYTQWRQWSGWTGPLFWFSHQDLGTNASNLEHNFGLVTADGRAKPAYARFAALNARAAPQAPETAAPSQPTPAPSPTAPTGTAQPPGTKPAPGGPTSDPAAEQTLPPDTTDPASPSTTLEPGPGAADRKDRQRGPIRIECE